MANTLNNHRVTYYPQAQYIFLALISLQGHEIALASIPPHTSFSEAIGLKKDTNSQNVECRGWHNRSFKWIEGSNSENDHFFCFLYLLITRIESIPIIAPGVPPSTNPIAAPPHPRPPPSFVIMAKGFLYHTIGVYPRVTEQQTCLLLLGHPALAW